MRLVAILLALLISVCGHVAIMSQESLTGARVEAAPLVMDRSEACVIVRWSEPEQIRQECGPRALACARTTTTGGVIWTERPRSWNDDMRLRTLGHELAHLLGGWHPR